MSEKITKFIEEIKTLTILELRDLVKAIEEEFGVSAAPVAVAAGPAAGGPAAGPAEEQTEFSVVLKDAGAQKIKVIKVVIEQFNVLKKLRKLQKTFLTQLRKVLAKKKPLIVEKFKEAGATVEIK